MPPGVDSSASAIEVVVRDVDTRQVVARRSAPHSSTQPLRSDQHLAPWWPALESAWARAGAPGVAAISVAGPQHGTIWPAEL